MGTANSYYTKRLQHQDQSEKKILKYPTIYNPVHNFLALFNNLAQV